MWCEGFAPQAAKSQGEAPQFKDKLQEFDIFLKIFTIFYNFSPPPSPGEGPLTATKTAAPARGGQPDIITGFATGFGAAFFPAPLKFMDICKINGLP